MKQDTIDIAEPDDLARARQTAARVAAARAALARDQASYDQLSAALASQPALDADTALTRAQTATVTAQGQLDAASGARTTAEKAAAQFTAKELLGAQTDLDGATLAVGQELARLLADATTSAALTATIDGLAVREKYRAALRRTPPLWDMTTIPLREHSTDAPLDPQIWLPALDDTGTDYPSLLAVLARHDDRVDAVADLVAAEALHQLVNGNPARAGAALDVAASGSVPDGLEVIATPRRGHDITHRVLVLTDAAPAPVWASTTPCLAAQVDPVTTAWVSGLLPDPAGVTFVVHRLDPQTGAAGPARTLSADVLGLDPLAWLRVAADRGELLARIAAAARAAWTSSLGEAAQTGRVHIADPSPPDPERLTLTDLVTDAIAAGRALRTARALSAGDLLPPGQTVPDATPETATAALATVQTAAGVVAEVVRALTAITADTPAGNVIPVLFAASALGISEATPALQDGPPDAATLHAQVATAIARLAPRSHLPALTAAATSDLALTSVRERLSALCGVTVPLPVAVPATVDAATRADFDSTPPRAGASPPQVRGWLYDHALVRPAVAALLDSAELAEALGLGNRLDVRATQLPPGPGPWIGSDPAPPPGATGLVACRSYQGPLPAAVSGFAVDAWAQTVPGLDHDTAVAFHYDEPNALPPQAILVAAAPDLSPNRSPATWDLDTLLEVVTATMALAADRAAAAELVPGASITVPDQPPSS